MLFTLNNISTMVYQKQRSDSIVDEESTVDESDGSSDRIKNKSKNSRGSKFCACLPCFLITIICICSGPLIYEFVIPHGHKITTKIANCTVFNQGPIYNQTTYDEKDGYVILVDILYFTWLNVTINNNSKQWNGTINYRSETIETAIQFLASHFINDEFNCHYFKSLPQTLFLSSQVKHHSSPYKIVGIIIWCITSVISLIMIMILIQAHMRI